MTIYRIIFSLTIFACFLMPGSAMSVYCQVPFLDPADDASRLPAWENVVSTKHFSWTPEQKLVAYRNLDKVLPTRIIKAGGTPLVLSEEKVDLGQVNIPYEDSVLTTDEYFVRQNVAGLLVIKNGRIVYERYGFGNSRDTRWNSFSVAKSVTSMLIGAAIQDGYIRSLDEKVTDYLPRLKGSSYDQANIGNILQMASGVAWNEDYADPDSDLNNVKWRTLDLYKYLRDKPVGAAPGEVFNYNTAETNLVGNLLRSAIGNNLSTYLSEKIWRPFGMEADANWLLSEPGGGEEGGCCIGATLRDYGRLGLFALGNGRLADDTPVLPDNWIAESTAPSKGNPGYGYLWWLSEGGAFKATGIFGQGIYIDPQENVVIALQSLRADASKDSDWALQNALYDALTEELRELE